MCIVAIAAIPKGTYVYVEEVLSNDQDQLQYVISGQLYLYNHFHLCIKFWCFLLLSRELCCIFFAALFFNKG